MITRRGFLKMVAIGAAYAALPARRALAFLQSSVQVEPFQVPLRIPPVLEAIGRKDDRDLYALKMRRAEVEIIPGTRTEIWGFNGRFPGPTIKVRSGEPVIVRQINKLDVPATIHLHGGHVRPQHDGHPTDLIQPGEQREFRYPNKQIAATLWYHDHTHHATSRNIYMGLAGLYIITDDFEEELNLPSGEFDVPLVIQDRAFKADGSFRFSDDHDEVEGDVFLVNGRPMPFFEVADRKYRFRILNASNSRIYDLALDPGLPITQIGSDGGLLPASHVTQSILLSPAERAELVIDFAMSLPGTSVQLVDRAGATTPLDYKPVMRFDVVRQEEDTSEVPMTLRPIGDLPPSARERDFELSQDPIKGVWLINGKVFDAGRIDARPRLGDAETWTFRNVSNQTHPMHVHQTMFQVLDRDGVPPSGAEAGWKDTVRVESQETVRVAMRFADFAGKYVFHCHNLAHEDHAMMAQMRIG